ncbi:MAG TPA: CGNR zinc finger domain-containing protein [Mycobacterium sp.]|nr:CGNR zinc finger domain-containing protein [Mycobacterium sp.]
MSRTALPRHREVIDEPGLRFVEAFLSTSTADGAGDKDRDQLTSVAGAQRWLDGALRELRPVSRLTGTSGRLGRGDLDPLRTFRETLRAAFRADGPQPPDLLADYTSTVDVQWDPIAGVRYRSAVDGWRAVVGLTSVELLRAEAAGTLHRLKTCAYAPCGFPFIDQSPNTSRMWHDTKRCGNVMNLRAARARIAKAKEEGP